MKVIFIVKPIGENKLKQLSKTIEAAFDPEIDSFSIFETRKKGHAISLTQKAIDEKADVVVACGGDGTINEVARGLVETNVALGIIPLGSGNGIARHFKIPFGFTPSIELIKKYPPSKIDVGVVNGNYFLGNMGCALESHFIKQYQKNEWHGIWAYGVACLGALLSFKHQNILLNLNQTPQKISPFVFLISNTNQQGYDFTLTPNAVANDGKLDLFWMDKSSVMKRLKFLLYAVLRRKLSAPEINRALISELKIEMFDAEDFCVQVDGEHIPISEKTLEVKVLPKQLNAIVPPIA
jgi:diacylglycerol kinase (ATP)